MGNFQCESLDDVEESKNNLIISENVISQLNKNKYVTLSVRASEDFRVSVINTHRSTDKEDEKYYK